MKSRTSAMSSFKNISSSFIVMMTAPMYGDARGCVLYLNLCGVIQQNIACTHAVRAGSDFPLQKGFRLLPWLTRHPDLLSTENAS
ncbi:hypothetical protein CEXT_206041 [Caerostris extrusa]|uniref:Uncharacterized protein n=1 Tax=Caerostris extrusa TaxID=172846 RepID=A0AAV4XPB7_CAEEX|nr:hypothetical protein CEXT_206041 [Caerostris extrusa]